MSLFSAFTSIRDAQNRSANAALAVDKAQTKVTTSIMALNKAINAIVKDTENNIKGTERLTAAQAKFNALVEAGVTSGPKFQAALNELKSAQDAMSSSTVVGTNMIAGLGVKLDQTGASVGTLESKMRKQTKTNEGVIASFVGLSGGITTIIGAVSGMSQTITSATQTAGLLKGAFVDLKIAAAAGFGPIGAISTALGAIAVPAAIAGAAIGVFVGAVTAIRARMGDFDALGQKVGEVFPAIKGFLDEGRQAFINLSDGINTAISMVLGGFDSLTGGVLGAQKAWDGWTGVLAKGTGEMGLAGNAANLMTLSFAKSGDVLQVGAGKFKIVNGEMQRLNGSVLASSRHLGYTGRWNGSLPEAGGEGSSYTKTNNRDNCTDV